MAAGASRVIAVTGANRGAGYFAVRHICADYAKSPLNTGPLVLDLTARRPERGITALFDLLAEPDLQRAGVRDRDGFITLRYHQLDTADPDSINRFRNYLKTEHPNGIDVRVNNAAHFDSNYDREFPLRLFRGVCRSQELTRSRGWGRRGAETDYDLLL